MVDAVGHRQLVERGLQLAAIEGQDDAAPNGLGGFGRQSLGHLAPEELSRRGGGLRAVAVLVVEIGAVPMHHEDHVGHGTNDRRLLFLQLAQVVRRLRGAQHVARPMAQNRPVDRFGDEVVGAHLVGLGDRVDIVHAGDHDHRHLGRVPPLPNATADLEAVDARHVDVEQHQVRRRLRQQCQPRFAIGRCAHRKSELDQRFLLQHAHHLIVVDDQHRGPAGRLR